MLLPGYRGDSLVEIDIFLEGYETFRRFDRRTLRLIGPLRAMRFIHYMAWCAHQVAEDGHSRVAPDFGTPATGCASWATSSSRWSASAPACAGATRPDGAERQASGACACRRAGAGADTRRTRDGNRRRRDRAASAVAR